MLTNVNFNIH